MSNEKNLTPEKLKTYKGLENLTDKEAEYLCEQIKNYSAILLRAFPFEKIKEELNKTKK
jgi:hypothetical protein